MGNEMEKLLDTLREMGFLVEEVEEEDDVVNLFAASEEELERLDLEAPFVVIEGEEVFAEASGYCTGCCNLPEGLLEALVATLGDRSIEALEANAAEVFKALRTLTEAKLKNCE